MRTVCSEEVLRADASSIPSIVEQNSRWKLWHLVLWLCSCMCIVSEMPFRCWKDGKLSWTDDQLHMHHIMHQGGQILIKIDQLSSPDLQIQLLQMLENMLSLSTRLKCISATLKHLPWNMVLLLLMQVVWTKSRVGCHLSTWKPVIVLPTSPISSLSSFY